MDIILFTRFCAAAATFLELGLNSEQLIGFYNELIASAKITGDTSIEMLLYIDLVAELVELKEYQKAILYAKKGISRAKETGDQCAEMTAYVLLVPAYMLLQQYDNVILYSKKCIDIAKETGDQRAEMNAYPALGHAYFLRQQYDDAILYSNKCVDIAKETGDQLAEMNAYSALVHAYISMTEFENALRFAREGLTIAKKHGNDDDITRFSHQLTSIYDSLNMDKKSLNLLLELEDAECLPEKDEREDYKTLKDNLDQARQTNNFLGHSEALDKLSMYHSSKREYDMAIECQKKILALDIGHYRNDGKNTMCLSNMARLYVEMGRYDEALQHYHDGLTCANKCNNRKLQYNCCVGLGYIYTLRGETNKAMEFFAQEIEYCEFIFDRLSQDEHQINIVDRYVQWYKTMSFNYLRDGKVKKSLLFAERCRARALRQRLITAHGIKQDEAGKDYQLQYSDVISTRAYSILFYILFFDVAMSIILIQMGEISAYPLASFDEIEMKSLINECYDGIGVTQIFKCENRSLDTTPVCHEDKL